MKKHYVALSMVAMLALGACGSKSEDCTPELTKTKTEELTKAVQEVVSKDPTKGAEVMKKMQDVMSKYATADQKEACKAIDELVKEIKS